MKQLEVIAALSALAQPTRLAAIHALTKAGEGGMRVGDLAAVLGAPHNTMSAHLAILTRARLVECAKQGRTTTYRAVPGFIAELSGYLAGLAVGN